MTEKLQFFKLVALLLFLVGGTVYAAITTFRQVKQLKAAEPDPEETPSEPKYAPVTVKATVTDMGCAVKTEGWKTPKTVREFMVVFQTEDGQQLSFPVPEEMYDGFEKGQTGTLTVVDGQLYGFQPESPEL